MATLFTAVLAGPAAAFHKYSYGEEHSATTYNGFQDDRRAHEYSLGGGCVYEPTWLNFSGGYYWFELGYSHGSACGIGSAMHVYAYLQDPGFSGFIGTASVANNDAEHHFKAQKDSNFFVWNIGSLLSGFTDATGDTGNNIQAGLESYAPDAVVTNHAVYNLQRYVNGLLG